MIHAIQSQELQMAPRKPQWFLAAMSIRQGRLPREAELVPNANDRVLELEIISKLTGRCAEAKRRLSLAFEAFPCDLHQQLDQFMSGRSCETMASSSVQSSCVAI